MAFGIKVRSRTKPYYSMSIGPPREPTLKWQHKLSLIVIGCALGLVIVEMFLGR